MTPFTQNMNQVATYWPFVGVDSFNKPAFGPPTPIKCRWQDKQDLFRTPEGEQKVSAAVVYPDRELLAKGYLFLGTSDTINPRAVEGAVQILQKASSPSLGGTRVLHKVWL